MVRYYCDRCGKQIARNYVADRLRGTIRNQGKLDDHPLTFEVIAGIGAGNANGGHVCLRCLADGITAVVANDGSYNDPMNGTEG